MFLVLGTPDPVAVRLLELLSERAPVVTVTSADVNIDFPGDVDVLVGDPASIDFGLSGHEYTELLQKVTEVILVDTTHVSARDVESSRVVRQAAEVVEFVRAGGAPGGVRHLSSLLVFGGAFGIVSEDELRVGQSFGSSHEEALAVSEKLIQSLRFVRPVAIIRTGPVSGDERQRTVILESPLERMVREIERHSAEKGYSLSDLPVRFETVERAALAVFRASPVDFLRVIHLADDEPITHRQLVTWVASRLGRTIQESAPGTRPWSSLMKGQSSGSRALAGWGLRFDRKNAEALMADLLDRDDYTILERLFPPEEVGRA